MSANEYLLEKFIQMIYDVEMIHNELLHGSTMVRALSEDEYVGANKYLESNLDSKLDISFIPMESHHLCISPPNSYRG